MVLTEYINASQDQFYKMSMFDTSAVLRTLVSPSEGFYNIMGEINVRIGQFLETQLFRHKVSKHVRNHFVILYFNFHLVL